MNVSSNHDFCAFELHTKVDCMSENRHGVQNCLKWADKMDPIRIHIVQGVSH